MEHLIAVDQSLVKKEQITRLTAIINGCVSKEVRIMKSNLISDVSEQNLPQPFLREMKCTVEGVAIQILRKKISITSVAKQRSFTQETDGPQLSIAHNCRGGL